MITYIITHPVLGTESTLALCSSKKDVRAFVWNYLWKQDYRYVDEGVRASVTYNVLEPDGWSIFTTKLYDDCKFSTLDVAKVDTDGYYNSDKPVTTIKVERYFDITSESV